ncbi:hypothetical protein HLP83_003068 [Shigella flexneri]|nr:hypothetical protein [Shigella flexneri]EFP9456933.1 hypothetical protein [Shigella flexneri]EFP9460980.1 hypothetical protein [Shigella flexneri]EFP9631471.1 hypothetical protein [Shigella flexneri]EFP9639806.1 hypothetical protein [Shigella flexneri]
MKKHIWPCEMMGFYQLRGLVFCYLWQIIANIPNLQNEIVMWITFLPLSIVRGG